MLRNAFLISFLIYLISCTSSDNVNHLDIPIAIPVKSSTGSSKSKILRIADFSSFLEDLSSGNMVPASETHRHATVKNYLPDSTISDGFDLHIQEIGRIDTFRLVFHEYFDLYDDWSNTYLDIFSPEGNILHCLKLWDLSFEGNTNINFINDKIIEIAYYDFFNGEKIENLAIIPSQAFYLEESSKVSNRIEGTIYEYYEINDQGQLKRLSQKTKIAQGRYFPQSSAKLLSLSELKQYEIHEINLMKEEILAQNGHIFTDLPTQNYFEMQSWYNPNQEFNDSLLTDIERLNLSLLTIVQKEY